MNVLAAIIAMLIHPAPLWTTPVAVIPWGHQ